MAAATAWLVYVGGARAQTDEIQVYDAQIAAPGVFNLTLHDNYTPDGRTSPDYPGASFRITRSMEYRSGPMGSLRGLRRDFICRFTVCRAMER